MRYRASGRYVSRVSMHQEFVIHVGLVEHLRRFRQDGVVFFHPSSGEERTKRVQSDTGKVFCPGGTRLQRMGMRKGVPDLVILHSGRIMGLAASHIANFVIRDASDRSRFFGVNEPVTLEEFEALYAAIIPASDRAPWVTASISKFGRENTRPTRSPGRRQSATPTSPPPASNASKATAISRSIPTGSCRRYSAPCRSRAGCLNPPPAPDIYRLSSNAPASSSSPSTSGPTKIRSSPTSGKVTSEISKVSPDSRGR